MVQSREAHDKKAAGAMRSEGAALDMSSTRPPTDNTANRTDTSTAAKPAEASKASNAAI
jgi:hypothetical protein